MSRLISIAIDGPAGAGKSTLAREAARVLGCTYVDTGAIYRTVALYCEQKRAETPEQIATLLSEIRVDLVYDSDGTQRMLLNGEDVSEAIRTPEISMRASAVSALPAVRDFLLEQQRELARTRSVIMDGRDIGTVVLPDATVKIYLTAAPEVRAQRRCAELCAGGTDASFDEILRDVQQRDYNDSHRSVAPLRQAEGAHRIDTTSLDLRESLDVLLRVIREDIADGAGKEGEV